MIKEFPLSIEEEAAINALGGFDQVVTAADRILGKFGIEKSLFSDREKRRIHLGRDFVKRQIEFNFDPGKSLHANIQDLLQQADDLQKHSGGTNYVGAML